MEITLNKRIIKKICLCFCIESTLYYIIVYFTLSNTVFKSRYICDDFVPTMKTFKFTIHTPLITFIGRPDLGNTT